MTASIPVPVVDLDVERQELQRARTAVQDKLARLATISGGGADALADEYIDAVVRGSIEKFQQDLVVFGRIDDDRPWRVGLYGIDQAGDQLVIDWRAPPGWRCGRWIPGRGWSIWRSPTCGRGGSMWH